MLSPKLFKKAVAALALVAAGTLAGIAQSQPALVPLPAKIEISEGKFTLNAETKIFATAGTENEAKLLAERLRASTGLPLQIVTSKNADNAAGNIVLRLLQTGADVVASNGAYSLVVSGNGAVITARESAGIFYGTQTFLQLLPPQVFSKTKIGHIENRQESTDFWSAPCIQISDTPAFGWRGLHLDTARHFFPKEFVKKYIDLMAQLKMNRFHWHLVDSEAWRLEIKKYPKLTEVSESSPAWYESEEPTDKSRPAKFQYGRFHGGGYYTQEDVREIVAYAKERHIDVMPEIEFPGHMMAVLTAYPEFSTTGKVPTIRSNHSPDLINIDEKSLNFLRDILDETMELFPFDYIHFGGDEAPHWQWKQSEYVQQRMKEIGIKAEPDRHGGKNKDGSPATVSAEQALQAWLFNQMAEHVKKRGKKPVGWEEIMHGNNVETLTKDAVIMPWLRMNSAVKAANEGFDVLVCTTSPFYLDSYQTTDPNEPWTYYGGGTLARIYNYDLQPDSIKPENRKHILGAQGQMWTELAPKPANVEYQAFPRAAAIAELLWTPAEDREYDQFARRLVNQAMRWKMLDVNFHPLQPLPAMKWTPKQIKKEFAGIEDGVTAQIKKADTYKVTFGYQSGGNGLDIQSVQLLANGDVVAEDKHDGFAGGQSRDNVYALKVEKYDAKAKYTLRAIVKGSGGTDSRGEITFGR